MADGRIEEGFNKEWASRSTNQYSIGIKVMGNYAFSCHTNGYRSPKHCSSFIDEDGQMYLFYHTRFERGGERVRRGMGDYSVSMDTFKVASQNCLDGSYFADPDFSGKYV